MPRSVPDITMSGLSAFLAKEMGLHFPRERWSDLEAGLVSAAREFGVADLQEFVRWLISAPLTRQQIEKLAGFLTIGETYFFRDPRTLDALQNEILPGLIRSRRGRDQRLRVWSAGCSTGEEPYTLAILLHRLLPDIGEWKITILATDINAAALRKGMGGVYGKWSFRSTPAWFKGFFKAQEGGAMRVAEHIRRMVSFEYLNLAEDSYPSLATNTNAMDLIFCRNVIMYFSHDMARTVVGKLQMSLVDDGWLILGPAESTPPKFTPLEMVSLAGVVCYRKRRAAPGAPHHPAATPEEAAATPNTSALARREEGLAPVPERLSEAPGRGSGQPAAQRGEHPAAPAAQPEPAGTGSFCQAALFYRQGLYQQAAATLKELSERGGLPREALTLLIRSQANRGKLAEALAICDETLREDKLDPSLHFLRAEILQEQGRSAEAQLSLRRTLYLDPKLVLAHFALGNLRLWSGDAERACKHFDNAMSLLEPLDPAAIVPGSEGMTAGRLREILASMESCAGRGERRRK